MYKCIKIIFLGILLFITSCEEGTEADQRGVGSQCATSDECTEEGQECLPFKGGYCGIKDCNLDSDCPEGSKCVTHTDAMNYCFLTCTSKTGCNINRDEENESNCSSNIDFIEEPELEEKACVPPSADSTI